MLTLPADGLIVPTNATRSSQPKSEAAANAIPVRTISADAASSSVALRAWASERPIASVVNEDPSRATVETTPTANGEKPSSVR